jgi:hypothetical protein
MTSGHPSDEEILRTLPGLPGDQLEAIGRVLARLEAAEKVCGLIKVSLSPKLRQAADRKPQWWDVGIAVKQWEDLPHGPDIGR